MQAPHEAHYYVYIVGSPSRQIFKVGIAGDLRKQVQEVYQGANPETLAEQEEPRLVYFEHYEREEIARNREQEIIRGGDNTAHRLIESMNPNWLDLSDMVGENR